MNPNKAIKQFREENGISRKELSLMLGVTQSAISKIERERVVPNQSTIKKFCKSLHIPVARFYIESLEPEDYA